MLVDLVLPVDCAGCGAQRVPMRYGTCAACAAELEGLTPYATRPEPPPPGMPACMTLGAYAGPLRGLLLAYKEQGRYRLARPLGALLASGIAAAASRSGGGPGVPLWVCPVPSTAAAARARQGDHLRRLAEQAVRRLVRAGWQAGISPLVRALPRPDSAHLSAAARAAVAESSLRIRAPRHGFARHFASGPGTLIVVDDIVTTGATLAAVCHRLEGANMQVAGAAVLAATQLRRPAGNTVRTRQPQYSRTGETPTVGSPNEG